MVDLGAGSVKEASTVSTNFEFLIINFEFSAAHPGQGAGSKEEGPPAQACPERAKRVEWIPPLGRYALSVGMTA